MGGHKSTLRHHRNEEFENTTKSFSPEELEKWKECFNQVSGGSYSKKNDVQFDEIQLTEYTKSILMPTLQRNLMKAFNSVNALLNNTSKNDHHKTHDHKEKDKDSSKRNVDTVSLETFLICISHLLKDGVDDKTRVFSILCGSDNLDGYVKKEHLVKTLKYLFDSYVLAESQTPECKTWKFKGESTSNELATYFVSDLAFDDQDRVSEDVMVRWMGTHSVLARVIDMVIYSAFHFEVKRDPDEVSYFPWTIPSCENLDWTKVHTMLTIPTLLVLNYQIPSGYRRQWRLLYTTEMYGESFSTLIKQIAKKGPTIMIIQDEEGRIFGGFNSTSWELSSNFLGDDSCFLFSLHPHVAIYTSSGYNKNYCYLNTNQDTLMNGLGFGGQAANNDYFALWLDSDFGKGRSHPSTIFNSPRLSANEYFKIRAIEVWAVESVSDAIQNEKAAKSILDIDPEVKAILEMAGKTQKSDGLREPHLDDEPKKEKARKKKAREEEEDDEEPEKEKPKPAKGTVLDMNPEEQELMEMAGRTKHRQAVAPPPDSDDDDEPQQKAIPKQAKTVTDKNSKPTNE